MEGPEVPLEAVQEHIHEHAHGHHDSGTKARWILGVALTSAVVAALAAVSALKAGHHANEALISQIDANNLILKASDQWALYQAKGVKLAVLQNKIDLLKALKPTAPGTESHAPTPPPETAPAPTPSAEPATEPAAEHKHEAAPLDKAAKKKETDEEKAKRYGEEQEGISEKAKELEHEADEKKKEGKEHLEIHLGLAKSVTMFQICIAIAAVSVLTNRRLFWLVSLAFAAYGVYAMIIGLKS